MYIVYNLIVIKLLIHLTKLHTWTIYQADVYAVNRAINYYGLTENEFKKRCSTTRHPSEKYPNATQHCPHLEAKG